VEGVYGPNIGTRGKPRRGGSGGHIPRTLPREAGTCTGCPCGNSGLRGGYCHGACQLLGLDPWRRLECRRKECGVTPSGRMECGVTPSGRRISLKGAVAHFFLSFFLPFFLPHATTCLSPFSNRSILPQPLFTCPVSAAAVCFSCPCPVSAAAARRPCPVRSCPRPPPRAVPVLSDPVLGHRRAPTSSLSRYPKPCRPGHYKFTRSGSVATS